MAGSGPRACTGDAGIIGYSSTNTIVTSKIQPAAGSLGNSAGAGLASKFMWPEKTDIRAVE